MLASASSANIDTFINTEFKVEPVTEPVEVTGEILKIPDNTHEDCRQENQSRHYVCCLKQFIAKLH